MEHVEYSDLYDRSTVAACRRLVAIFDTRISEIAEDDPERDMKIQATVYAHNVQLWSYKGERAENKDSVIHTWVERNKQQDQLLASTQPQANISCLRCQTQMQFMDKHLDHADDIDRVILFYECQNHCQPKRAFYNDGSEYRIKSSNCSSCSGQTIEKTTRKEQLITTTSICKRCGHINRYEIDLSPEPEVIDEYFAEDRTRYCLSIDELAEYREGKTNTEQLTKFLRDRKIKEDTNIDTSLPIIQILKVIEVFQLVKNSLESLRFEQIQMLTPATKDGIRIQFSALDSDSNRSDGEAVNASNDILEKALKQTNWRLIPKSLISTLGALNFELKGYTHETDLKNIVITEKAPNYSRKLGDITL